MFQSMNTAFNTILVPVDFSDNSTAALEKALELCKDSGCTLHLLHMPRIASGHLQSFYQYFSGSSLRTSEFSHKQVRLKFDRLIKWITDKGKDIKVCAWLSYGSTIEEMIVEKAKKFSADLIVIGKRSYHSWLPFLNTVIPSRLATNTGIPVLTVKARNKKKDHPPAK